MMISGKTVMAFLIAMLALGAQAASFDCAKAFSLVDKAICAESRLSALDEQLATSYKETLANVADVDSLKAGQLAWLKNRNQCRESACLVSAYQRRIKELDHYTEKFTGVLINGGGIDNMALSLRAANGRTVHAYCNRHCGDDWFMADRDEVSSLIRKFINRPVSVTVARQRNKDRIAGPGNDEVLAFITALDFPGK
jgi:uncharacterized protein